MTGNAELRALATALQAENEKLRAALRECADDLEAELKARHGTSFPYLLMAQRFERDMEPVRVARRLADRNIEGTEP
jgi:hypothetical protein